MQKRHKVQHFIIIKKYFKLLIPQRQYSRQLIFYCVFKLEVPVIFDDKIHEKCPQSIYILAVFTYFYLTLS